MMLQEALKKVVDGQNLSEQEMVEAMTRIMEGRAGDAQIAAFLTGLRMKGETVDEIAGAARVMRQKAVAVPLRSRSGLVDIVGTGGDGTNTFNISTAAAFVAAGAGVRVAKHGNRSVSSRCGSADVMEAMGVKIDIAAESVGQCIDEIGIGFLFAPTFHLAMKYAAPVRKALGIRTVFNILGPLTNPADAETQLVGVYDANLTETVARVLLRLGRRRALVVHGDDGLDEISISTTTQVYELRDGGIEHWAVRPGDYGLPTHGIASINGGTAADNAEIITGILQGKTGAYRDCVLMNAGAAIMAAGASRDMQEGIRSAAASIDSGNALQKLNLLRDLTQQLSRQ